MADTDSSSYILRYNLVSNAPEYFAGADWYGVTLPPGDLVLANTKILVGNASGLAAPVSLSGGATIANTGVLTLSNTAITGQLLTGYVSGAGTVAATDTILQGINKLNGNDVLKLTIAAFTDAAVTSKLLTGYVSGAGTVAATDTILQGINKLNGNDATRATAGAVGSSGLTQNTAKLLGRTTASAGAIEEITVGSGLSLSAGSLTATGGSTTNIVTASTTTDTNLTTANTLTSTTLTASITPSLNTSKILIQMQGTVRFHSGGATNNQFGEIQIQRGSTPIYTVSRFFGISDTTTTDSWIPYTITFLDSPATTSATSYTLFATPITNVTTPTMEFQDNNDPAVIILTEIKV